MKKHISYILPILLLITGIGIAVRSFDDAPPTQVAREIATKLEEQCDLLERDKVKAEHAYNGQGSLAHADLDYDFLVFEDGVLVDWTSNEFIPTVRQVSDTSATHLLKSSGGDYLIRKWDLDSGRLLVGMIMLYRQYPITNDYLTPHWNPFLFPKGNITILETASRIGTPVCVSNECYFAINYREGEVFTHETLKLLAVVLLFGGMIGLFVLALNHLPRLTRWNPDAAFLVLVFGIWLLRYGMTYLDFPGLLYRFRLFDPQYYASSYVNRSLGDLLLNVLSLLLVCWYLFRNYHRMRTLRFVHRRRWVQVILSVAAALIFFLSLYFPYLVIQNIYNNSAITLDISQSIQFDSLRIVAFLIVVISWLCSFLFAHVFLRLLLANQRLWVLVISLLIGAGLFVVVNIESEQPYFLSLITSLVYALVIYLAKLQKQLSQVGYRTFTYFFLAIVCFSIVSSQTILQFTRKEKIETQFRFASNFLIDRDVFGEYLLRDVAEKVSGDAFIQSRLVSPFLSKDAIRQKIRQYFLPSYFNKYDVEIMLFGAAGTPFDNRSTSSFSDLLAEYDKEAFRTEYEGIFFISSPELDVTQRYLIVIPITRSTLVQGYIVLELLLKKVIPENVYPELLIDSRFQQFYRMHDMSYAVYGRELLYSAGAYNYELDFDRTILGNPDIHLVGIVHNNYVHVAEEDESNRAAVVSTPVVATRYIFANFSFLLVLGLSILLLFVLIQGLVNWLRGRTMSFSTRIQIFLNLAFFLPLIIVSVTTLQFTGISSREQLNSEYLSKSRSFGSQVSSLLDEYTLSPDVNRPAFENQLADMAKVFNLDANVFSPTGRLLASSQPFIFESGLISPYISPEALEQVLSGQNLFITTDEVGSLQFNVCYATLRSSQRGELIGVLALPFFQSVHSLEKIKISILANILNVFSGIFIALIVLSYLVSEWLTFPLKFITTSLSKTSLVKTNEPLRWKADDEIGMMVKEYNQMLYKLSESKAELEQTQRERAWREIAQQVAHEIKNPLTPMKLTLQQLERSLEGGGDVREKTLKAVSSMLSQVETLNEIASSFSSFAKMPEPDIQRIELMQLVRRIIDLHSQSGTIHLLSSAGEVFVNGDEQLLGRIFSNLIINAFQSARPGIPLRVNIGIDVQDQRVRITFRDNGRGIDSKLLDRVFVPHFSTKRSGSGLGLAISKQGIEYMHGRIWFETQFNAGTSFYIELPVASGTA